MKVTTTFDNSVEYFMKGWTIEDIDREIKKRAKKENRKITDYIITKTK